MLNATLLGATAAGMPAVSFARSNDLVLLNNAGTHPLHPSAAAAVRNYIDYKQRGEFPPDYSLFGLTEPARAAFARLINASPDEVALTQSTSMGENIVVRGLGLIGGKGNIVTDALHHEGSLYLYDQIASRDLEIRVARPANWEISLGALDRLIDRDTKLVAVSFVSWVNGFEHDLMAVCEIAHAKGALVYADIIQGAGIVPLDVRATGVDFAGCATYKWLMGDCGVGFLYVRSEHLDRVKRGQWGFMQLRDYRYHVFPGDPPADKVMTYDIHSGARGRYEVGTPSFSGLAAAAPAIEFVLNTGVERIGASVRPLVDRVQEELPKLGFVPMTPRSSRAAIASFLVPDARRTAAALKSGKVQARLMGRQLRVSPAIHNDQDDIDKLVRALKT